MQQTNWCVITGAPCSGKTSVINRLSELGYTVAHEVAREYINRLLNNREFNEASDDTMKLQHEILNEKLNRELNLSVDELVFFDRGLPDSIAYYQIKSLDDKEVRQLAEKFRYRRIFMFERLPFQTDPVRKESEETARRLDGLIRKAYVSVGYDIISVPVMSIDKRVDFVLKHA